MFFQDCIESVIRLHCYISNADYLHITKEAREVIKNLSQEYKIKFLFNPYESNSSVVQMFLIKSKYHWEDVGVLVARDNVLSIAEQKVPLGLPIV